MVPSPPEVVKASSFTPFTYTVSIHSMGDTHLC